MSSIKQIIQPVTSQKRYHKLGRWRIFETPLLAAAATRR